MLTGRVIGLCTDIPVHSRSKQDKAHRRKQGAGVVPYVKPLSRSNAVLRRLLDEHGIRNAYGTRDRILL